MAFPITNSSWKKEDELRSLKGQAAELDRKIALTITTEKENKEEFEKMGNSDLCPPQNLSAKNAMQEMKVRHKIRF